MRACHSANDAPGRWIGQATSLPRTTYTHSPPVGYIWKRLVDEPSAIGITKGVESDHAPHFHEAAECYYVVEGGGMTLCDGTFRLLTAGQYLYIPGNAIHNTPILDEGGLSVLYWFPQHAYGRIGPYYWRKEGGQSADALARFAIVDRLRRECASDGWRWMGSMGPTSTGHEIPLRRSSNMQHARVIQRRRSSTTHCKQDTPPPAMPE